MSRDLKQLGEFGLIEKIRRSVPVSKKVVLGIGDDAAVLEAGRREWQLATSDMLAEGTHFTRRDKPRSIGHKALACSISDIAAMGGIPDIAIVSLGTPGRISVDFLRKIQAGLNATARRFAITIAGGDTIRHQSLVINVTLLGRVEKRHLVTRAGARPGDHVFVTGRLGGSLASGRHLTFSPRLPEAQFLVRHLKPSAMIDISDGLVPDLGHILDRSRVGAVLEEDAIPRRRTATLDQALYDGEDFELLFTLPPDKARRWQRLRSRPFIFYPIGKIVSGAGRMMLASATRQKVIKKRNSGFAHF